MPASSQETVTLLLEQAQQGSTQAFDRLYALIYDELRRLAHVVRRGHVGPTLNTTALVHEAYFKLLPSKDLSWQGRSHFFRVAARAMRQVIINEAERQQAEKRGGGHLTVAFDERIHAPITAVDLLTLNTALQRLEALNPRQAEVVECRFFAGLTVKETAHALGVSPPTVKRDWRTARAWLSHALGAA
jgi:RNA polymerase sigma factor (TIGR02999 family)